MRVRKIHTRWIAKKPREKNGNYLHYLFVLKNWFEEDDDGETCHANNLIHYITWCIHDHLFALLLCKGKFFRMWVVHCVCVCVFRTNKN